MLHSVLCRTRLVALIVCVSLAGCGDLDPPGQEFVNPILDVVFAIPEQDPSLSKVTLYDASGSLSASEREACQASYRRDLRDAKPGDFVQLRLIGRWSYRPEYLLSQLTVPEPEPAPAYSTAQTGSQDRYEDRIDSIKKAELRKLDSLGGREPEPYTDIYGALAAAREVLERVDPEVKVVEICGDLADTRKDRVSLDLSGIHIFLRVSPGKAGSTSELFRRRDEWRDLLLEMGADRVESLAPGEALRLHELRELRDRQKSRK